jgi:glycosyltransferase involved in cell wall biosynthesis
MRDVLIKAGVDVPIDVVPNGIDLEPYRQPIEPLQRADLGFEDQDVLLINVGRLTPEKNLNFLLRAFSAALQAYSRLGLILVGRGDERPALEALIREQGMQGRVFFTGLIPYTDIPRYLSIADAFVTASVTEVHPFTVIEAMAAGLPVLGINSPGVGDTVQDGRNGFLCPQEDAAIFSARLMRLAMDEAKRREMGATAREDAKIYSIENTNRMMLERYQKVIEKAASRKQKKAKSSGGWDIRS